MKVSPHKTLLHFEKKINTLSVCYLVNLTILPQPNVLYGVRWEDSNK